jgi:4-carboxymuconolactone decarboxylase
MPRLPDLERDDLNPEQLAVYDSIAGGARGRVSGPFKILLHSPGLASRMEQMGVYIRYNSTVPQRYRELAICIVSHHWKAAYEWHVHSTIAMQHGVSEAVLEAVGTGRKPICADEGDALICDYVPELLATGRVSDALYERAAALFKPQGVLDLTGLVGYYTQMALAINVFGVGIPEGRRIPWLA